MRLTLPSPLLRCAALLAAALPTVPAFHQAQAQAAPPATPSVLITAPVENNALVTLKGNTHPMAQARYDRGAASASLPTGRMSLILKRSPAQSIALRAYMGEQQDPNSPNYRKWLTPASYGASFGISDADLQTVEAWLQSQGFKIESVPDSRNLVRFSGTFGQVAQAFHTSIHTYVIDGVTHYSNASDPQIPAALAAAVAGISPMNDFRAKAMHVLGKHNTATVANGHVQVTAQAASSSAGKGIAPELTVSENNANLLLLSPSDAATIYNAPNVLNRRYSGSGGQNGAGVNIGVAEYSDLQVADYNNYRNLFLPGIAGPAPQLVVDGADPGVLQGDGVEALLDAEIVAALAPQAQLYFYSSSSDLIDDGLDDAIVRAIEDNKVSVLSISYGNCEYALGQGGNLFFSEFFQQAAAQGITPVISAGDSGSAGCDDPNTEAAAQGGLAVSGIASTPYGVAVGGTDFDVLATNFTQYVLAAGTAENSYLGSALSYIPENPWNDSIQDPQGLFTSNVAQQYNNGAGGTTTIISAGSGGASSAGVCSLTDQYGGCVSPGYPTPPFQSAINVGTAAPAGVRYIPDVSLFAAAGSEHSAAWAFCSDSVLNGDSSTYTDCVADSTGALSVESIGGTSASTPAFAGVLGMVIQSLGGNTRLGLANDVLYNLQAKGSPAFNDITVGNNSVPCVAGSLNCGSNGFLAGYNAGTGYDLASGLGSVNITKLIAAWPTVVFNQSSTVLQVNNSSAALNVVHGTVVTLSTQVSPSTAIGTVSITGNSGNGNESAFEDIALTTVGAQAGTGSIGVNNLPGGTYNLQAYFPGDVNLAASASLPVSITITPEASTPNLFLNIGDLQAGTYVNNPANAPFGSYGFAYFQPLNSNNPTVPHGSASGTATLTVNGASVGSQALNSAGIAAFPLYNLTPGTYTFTGQYNGDNSYSPSSASTPIALTIGKGMTSLIIHGGTVAAGATTRTLTVEIDTDSASSTLPSGGVTFSLNGKALTGGTTASGLTAYGADAEFISFAVPLSSLTSSNSLQASYPGDNNYLSSAAVPCSITATTSALQPLPGSSGTKPLLAGGGIMALSSVLLALMGRRRIWSAVLVALFAFVMLATVGCGSNVNSTPVTVGARACAQ